jgi:CxxC motif-containing protein (DUF1111 family)
MSQKPELPQSLRILPLILAPILWALWIGASHAPAADNLAGTGRALFEHKWVVDDPVSSGGDGLGPMYNADSCVACHYQGAIGGAGPGDRNVTLLSLAVANKRLAPGKRSAIQSNAEKIHPGFDVGPGCTSNIILHQFSTEPRYARWRLGLLGQKLPVDARPAQIDAAIAEEQKRRAASPVIELQPRHGMSLRLVQRNTPALFGTGLINAISDETLLQLEEQQAKDASGIHGRVGRTADGKVGRFGWRGQVASLRDFSLTACSMELGLENERHLQAKNPLEPHNESKGKDLNQAQCDALVGFVASLPAPRQLAPVDQKEAKRLGQGALLFEGSGCVACHVRKVADVDGIYSDLLLHDMGPALEDPVPAFPEKTSAKASVERISSSSSSYGGTGSFCADVPSLTRREWKTTPLWGVRDSAPYLHDGRARTIEEAIALHGGEAASSAKKFADLDYVERSQLLMFLNSLAAPEIR